MIAESTLLIMVLFTYLLAMILPSWRNSLDDYHNVIICKICSKHTGALPIFGGLSTLAGLLAIVVINTTLLSPPIITHGM